MAGPIQLMRVVSDATGMALPTVMDIDRRLVLANLRTTGGRGRNAARMTPVDAARLLTAILTSPHANSSAEAVKRYAATHCDREQSSDNLFATTAIDQLIALPARHSFVDALAALIASASTGALAKLIAATPGLIPRIEVSAFTRSTRGGIRLAGLPDGRTTNVEYIAVPAGSRNRKGKAARSGPPLTEAVGDLEQSRRLTQRTILPIAALLAQEE